LRESGIPALSKAEMKTLTSPALARARAVALALAAAGAFLPASAAALCMASGDGCGGDGGGARFLRPEKVTPYLFGIGDVLPDGYQMLMNTRYYGLPPARDGWQYYRVEQRLLRVDRLTREILEDATNEANRAF
jgi:hypothetical protein